MTSGAGRSTSKHDHPLGPIAVAKKNKKWYGFLVFFFSIGKEWHKNEIRIDKVDPRNRHFKWCEVRSLRCFKAFHTGVQYYLQKRLNSQRNAPLSQALETTTINTYSLGSWARTPIKTEDLPPSFSTRRTVKLVVVHSFSVNPLVVKAKAVKS